MKPETAFGGNFDRVAPLYDILAFAVFGRSLQRAQAVYLNRILPPYSVAGASVLILGGGTGWLLEEVLRAGQSADTVRSPGRVLYLESSARMLAKASRRMLRRVPSGTVEFRLGDQRAIRPGEQFDVIMTPFVLDLFTDETLETRLIPRLRNALRPGGLWLATDFVQTRVWWQRAVLWSMIRFFRLTAGIETRQLAHWQRLLAQAGLSLQERRSQVNGLVSAEVWKL